MGGHSTGQAQPVQDPSPSFSFSPALSTIFTRTVQAPSAGQMRRGRKPHMGPRPHHLICRQSLSQCNGRNDAAPLPRQRVVPPPPNSKPTKGKGRHLSIRMWVDLCVCLHTPQVTTQQLPTTTAAASHQRPAS